MVLTLLFIWITVHFQANANSASDPAISNVFTPVNAIVDGIGPLILPLIGYSRQALFNPRALGANTYQPENNNGQRPVQLLRNLPRGYGNGNPELAAYARGVPIKQQQSLSSLKEATNEQLIQEFNRLALV